MPTPNLPNQITRNIHFFRLDAGLDGADPIIFDPKPVLEHIDGLPFTDAPDDPNSRYAPIGQNTYCAWSEQTAAPARMRFAVVRRDGLPFIEEQGALTALDIPDAAGLVEQIHVIFFGNNIVGCDANFYGPRLPTLASYMKERGGPEARTMSIDPLARRNVLSVLEQYRGIKLLQLRVKRSHIDNLRAVDEDLAAAFDAQERLSEAEELEIILRPRAYSRGETLGQRLFGLVKELASRRDVIDVSQAFKVIGLPEEGPGQELNILREQLVSPQAVRRRPGRGRALDSGSAFAAIETAYSELEAELLDAIALEEDDNEAEDAT